MSFNLSGSLYNQALQVQKATKLSGYNFDTQKAKYTLSFSDSYKAGEIDPKPKRPEKHKLDILG